MVPPSPPVSSSSAFEHGFRREGFDGDGECTITSSYPTRASRSDVLSQCQHDPFFRKSGGPSCYEGCDSQVQAASERVAVVASANRCLVLDLMKHGDDFLAIPEVIFDLRSALVVNTNQEQLCTIFAHQVWPERTGFGAQYISIGQDVDLECRLDGTRQHDRVAQSMGESDDAKRISRNEGPTRCPSATPQSSSTDHSRHNSLNKAPQRISSNPHPIFD